MKMLIIFAILLALISAGPLAAGAWTVICGACAASCTAVPLMIVGTPQWFACVKICCANGPAISLFFCFDVDTLVTTPSGPMKMQNLHQGMKVETLNQRD